MPNWVYNSVVIEFDGEGENGASPEMFLREISGPHPLYPKHEGLNFARLVAPPEEFWERYKKEHIFGEERDEYNWYEWNIRNWNTKWNACEPEHKIDGRTLKLTFQTAWSPPENIFLMLSEKAREYEATLFEIWWEEEQGFGEELVWDEDKEITISSRWDIPESHADYVAQDKEEQCICGYYDPEDWFEDCPGKAEAVAKAEKESEVGAS